MIVSDAVQILKDEMRFGNHIFITQFQVMKTIDIIEHLESVDQNLRVLEFKKNQNQVVPEIHILVDGRKEIDEGRTVHRVTQVSP